ncbi:zinc-finger of acetyl-transferase ESCO, putative [Angomonas deanei]|uniref:Zinc-finger of acetyl-transferase ESCO, putative n=1 Tax=Angomonas deanei TaxID=59799 RepID=A0A7G2CUJ9_9TRYP|nr:zinc-finger of acetyl-transferase ESCO, putative [Angomonas deanei]
MIQRSLFDFVKKTPVQKQDEVGTSAQQQKEQEQHTPIESDGGLSGPSSTEKEKDATKSPSRGSSSSSADFTIGSILFDPIETNKEKSEETPLAPVSVRKRERPVEHPKKKQQTFLDFGQSSGIGVRCPHCSMLYTALEEDRAFHQKYCARVKKEKQQNSGNKKQSQQDGNLYRLCTTVFANLSKSKGKIKEEGAVTVHSPPQSPHLSCYLLRCHKKGVTADKHVQTLLSSVGFFDALLEIAEYSVAFVLDSELRVVLAAVAGRPSTREQDPQIIQTGPNAYRRQQTFTFFDINYIYLPPPLSLPERELPAPLRANKVEQLFHPPSTAAKDAERRGRAAVVLTHSVQLALGTLASHILYGESLSPQQHFSYATAIFNTQRSEGEWMGEDLRQLVTSAVGEELVEHEEEHYSDNDDGDSVDKLSVVSYD